MLREVVEFKPCEEPPLWREFDDVFILECSD